MKKLLFAGAMALALSACVTDRRLSDYVCTHRTSVTIAANAALSKAGEIKDPIARQAAIDTARATLDAVAACPPQG